MEFQGFTLDKFQEVAISGVDKNNSVLVSAPTGSGKTLIADYIIDKFLKQDQRIIYTAPIKALSNQKFKDFTKQYGEDRIGLITGDLVLNPTAQVLIMTTEVYRNMAIINDPVLDPVAYCIMDEIHYISDAERGYIWEESIIFSPSQVRFLFLSATIPNSDEFASWVKRIKGHEVEVVKHHVRPVPLDRKFFDSELGITTLDAIKEKKELDKYPSHREFRRGRYRHERVPLPDYRDLVRELRNSGQLPCIYFVFSRARTQEYALKLSQKIEFLSREEKARVSHIVSEEMAKLSPEIKSLKTTIDLRNCLSRGVAFHNAGMLPDMKHVVERLFGEGLLKVLFATETFAVGINMPAKTVCFDSLRKFTNTGFRYLNSKEYFQISGRAGRRGIDKKGLSVSVIHRPSADFEKIKSFTDKDVLPLKSQFKLTYNTVLNMIAGHSPEEIQTLLRMNLYTFQQLKGRPEKKVLAVIKARFTKLQKTLTKLGYVSDGKLTDLGRFASKIFADEMEVSQIFLGGLKADLDEYTILLAMASLVYEGRRGARFYNMVQSAKATRLMQALRSHPILKKGKWLNNIPRMTSIVDPCYNGKKFMEILKNSTLLEGDLIRLLLRIVDKLDQIDKATDDDALRAKMRNCKDIIKESLEGIHVV